MRPIDVDGDVDVEIERVVIELPEGAVLSDEEVDGLATAALQRYVARVIAED